MNAFRNMAILVIVILVCGGCYTILRLSGKSVGEPQPEPCRRYWSRCQELDWCLRWQRYYCYPWWYERDWFWYDRTREPSPPPKEKEQIERRRGLEKNTKSEKPDSLKKEPQDTSKTEQLERRRGF